MDIFFHCDKCGQHIVIDEASAGQLVDCPKCGKPLEVPHTSVAPVAVPRAPSAPPPAQRSRNKLPFAIRLLIVALTVACVTLATVFILLAKSRTGKAGSTAALADGKIDGEAFIVTKGAESIKIGLVEVGLFPMATLEPFLAKRVTEQPSEVASLKPLIAAAKAEVSRLASLIETMEAAKRRLDTVEFTAFKAALNAKFGTPGYDAADKKYKAAQDEAQEAKAAYPKPQELGQDALDKANEAQRKLEAEYSYVYSGAFYFGLLPVPVRVTKTNSDGRFSLQIPAEGEFAIGATASRLVGESVEHYYWLLRVRSQPGQTQTIMLSNDNKTSSSSRDSLIQTTE